MLAPIQLWLEKTERKMNGTKAIGHMCGKIAKIIYTLLKTGQKYDPKKHAEAVGIPWESTYVKRRKKFDTEQFHQEALEYAWTSTSDDI